MYLVNILNKQGYIFIKIVYETKIMLHLDAAGYPTLETDVFTDRITTAEE